MTEPRRFLLLDLSLLVLVVAVAAGARGWYLLECADAGRNAGPLRVQDAAPPDEPEPAASPGYPWLLSLSHELSDPDRTVRWAQAGLGALTAGLYFLFARRAFGSLLVAGLAGLFCALHPFWVVAAAQLVDGVLAAFLLGLGVWLGVRGAQSGGALTSLLYGLTLAGLGLVRAALLPFAFVAVLWFLWRCRSLPRGWLFALLAFLGFANALVPWGVHNYRRTGEPVPVTAAWRHLWIGNHPGASGGPEGVPPAEPGYETLSREVIEEVRRDPAETLNRRLGAGLSFVFGEEWLLRRTAWEDGVTGELPSWLAGSYRAILLGTLLGMLLLAFAGWRWSYGWRRDALPALAVAWLPLPYLLSHAEKLSGPRLPLDGVLLCFAAFALVWLLPGVGARLRDGAVSPQ